MFSWNCRNILLISLCFTLYCDLSLLMKFGMQQLEWNQNVRIFHTKAISLNFQMEMFCVFYNEKFSFIMRKKKKLTRPIILCRIVQTKMYQNSYHVIEYFILDLFLVSGFLNAQFENSIRLCVNHPLQWKQTTSFRLKDKGFSFIILFFDSIFLCFCFCFGWHSNRKNILLIRIKQTDDVIIMLAPFFSESIEPIWWRPYVCNFKYPSYQRTVDCDRSARSQQLFEENLYYEKKKRN